MYFLMKREVKGKVLCCKRNGNAPGNGIKQEKKAEEYCSNSLYEREMPLFSFRMATFSLLFLETKIIIKKTNMTLLFCR